MKCATPSRDFAPEVVARFLSKIDADGDCWEWAAGKSDTGYGRFDPHHGHPMIAHRYAWEALVGPISEGLTIDHLCRNPPCVNPDHLEPVTERVNILRGYAPSAQAARRDTCRLGHPYTPENTYNWGHRRCRTCYRKRYDPARRHAQYVALRDRRACASEDCRRSIVRPGNSATFRYCAACTERLLRAQSMPPNGRHA